MKFDFKYLLIVAFLFQASLFCKSSDKPSSKKDYFYSNLIKKQFYRLEQINFIVKRHNVDFVNAMILLESVERLDYKIKKITTNRINPPALNLNCHFRPLDRINKSSEKTFVGPLMAEKKAGQEIVGEIGKMFGGTLAGKATETLYDKASSLLTSKSCWASPEECEKKWNYLSLDSMPTMEYVFAEANYWRSLYSQILTPNSDVNLCINLPSKLLVEIESTLLEQQNEIKERKSLCENIKLLDTQIELAKVDENDQRDKLEQQLISLLKKAIEMRTDQINYLKIQKQVAQEALNEIEILKAKIAALNLIDRAIMP